MRHALSLFLVLWLAAPAAAGLAPADEAALRRGVEAAAAGRYEEALARFGEVAERSPGRPEGPFFRAAVYKILKGHFDRPAYREGMEKNAALALGRAEALIRRDPSDAEAHLYAGLTKGMLAVDAVHRRRYLSALRSGRMMVSLLERAVALDPALEDAYYALGLYHLRWSHWTWLRPLAPFFRASGERGVAYLRRAAERGRWLRPLARLELVWALYREGRFGEGRRELARLHRDYPEQPLYALARAEGYYLQDNHERARKEFDALYARFKEREDDLSRLYARFARWRMAQSDYALGRYPEAGREAREAMDGPTMESSLLRQVRVGAAALLDLIERADPSSGFPAP